MKDLVEYLIKNIVDEPKSVLINEENQDGNSILKVSVDKGDMGKVIGKSGRIIKSLRNLVKIKSIKENKKAFLHLEELESK